MTRQTKRTLRSGCSKSQGSAISAKPTSATRNSKESQDVWPTLEKEWDAIKTIWNRNHGIFNNLPFVQPPDVQEDRDDEWPGNAQVNTDDIDGPSGLISNAHAFIGPQGRIFILAPFVIQRRRSLSEAFPNAQIENDRGKHSSGQEDGIIPIIKPLPKSKQKSAKKQTVKENPKSPVNKENGAIILPAVLENEECNSPKRCKKESLWEDLQQAANAIRSPQPKSSFPVKNFARCRSAGRDDSNAENLSEDIDPSSPSTKQLKRQQATCDNKGQPQRKKQKVVRPGDIDAQKDRYTLCFNDSIKSRGLNEKQTQSAEALKKLQKTFGPSL